LFLQLQHARLSSSESKALAPPVLSGQDTSRLNPEEALLTANPPGPLHDVPAEQLLTGKDLQRQFEEQLQRLSTAIDTFARERTLVKALLDQNQASGPGDIADEANFTARPVEVEATPALLPPFSLNLSSRSTAPLDDPHPESENERSMELATPLQPTVLLTEEDLTAGLPAVIANIDPDPAAIPLPNSPESSHGTEAANGRGDGDDDVAGRMRELESELEAARREIERRDVALSDLRQTVYHLRGIMVSAETRIGVDVDDTWT